MFSQRANEGAVWEPYDPAFSQEIAREMSRRPQGGHIWCPFSGGRTFQVRSRLSCSTAVLQHGCPAARLSCSKR